LRSLVDFHLASRRFGESIDPEEVASAARALGIGPVLDIVSGLRERTFARQVAPAQRRTLRARVGMHYVTEGLMLDSPFRPRLDNWLRFLAASGPWDAAARSLGEILLPGRLELTRFFRQSFETG